MRCAGSTDRGARRNVVGTCSAVGPRLEDRPLVTGPADALPPTFHFPASCTCAWCARRTRTASSYRSMRARRSRCRACMRCGPPPISRDIPPIDFRLTRIEGTRALSAAGAGEGRCALCRRAGRRGLCGRSLSSPKTPPIWSSSRSRRCRRVLATDSRATSMPGRCDRSRMIRKGYGDVDAAFRNAHAIVALELSIGRHSGVPLETRGAIARYDAARDLLELHGAAKVPHWNRDTIAQHARPQPRRPFTSTKAMSAAASAFAANFILRTCWSARRAAASAGRSNGSRIGAST